MNTVLIYPLQFRQKTRRTEEEEEEEEEGEEEKEEEEASLNFMAPSLSLPVRRNNS